MESSIVTDENGNLYWLNENRDFHREDGPAVIYVYGVGGAEYWVNGKRHREDGPAVIWDDGHKEWWVNGKQHREDGPAKISLDGIKWFYLNGEHLPLSKYKQWFIAKISNPSYKLTDGDISFIKEYLA